MSKLSDEIVLREYANREELTSKADAILKHVSDLVEKELGSDKEGVTFMPTLNVVCRLKDDPTSNVDPVSFSVVKRPTSASQIKDIVQNILLRDPVFLSSITSGLAGYFNEMMTSHMDMVALVNSLGAPDNEETEVPSNENERESKEGAASAISQDPKKNEYEVN